MRWLCSNNRLFELHERLDFCQMTPEFLSDLFRKEKGGKWKQSLSDRLLTHTSCTVIMDPSSQSQLFIKQIILIAYNYLCVGHFQLVL